MKTADPPTADDGTKYEFTNDWFNRSIHEWNHLLHKFNVRRIAEIGSYEGRSACYFIENCGLKGPIEIYCIDTWWGGVDHDHSTMRSVESRFDRNIRIAQKRAKHGAVVHKVKSLSRTALPKIITEGGVSSFDLVYIDGSHQAPDVLQDAVLSFLLLRVGGLMVFDDYMWHMEPAGKQDSLNMPKPAIDAFINLFQRKLSVLPGLRNHQIWAKKISE